MAGGTFCVGVSDHMMVAHSLRGELFGPAQHLHGTTYEVRVEVFASSLDPHSIVVDIGALRSSVRSVLAQLDYQNLDDLEQLSHLNTTTEALARWIHEQLAASIAGPQILTMRVTLIESPVAWAAYEGPLEGQVRKEPAQC